MDLWQQFLSNYTLRTVALGAAALGTVSGALGALATGLFMVATQGGSLTVAAVLTSLYPAFTILLAASVLRESVHRAQAVGLVLCGAAIALVAGAGLIWIARILWPSKSPAKAGHYVPDAQPDSRSVRL